jgi:hypothetical protein
MLNERKKILEQPIYRLAPIRTTDVVFDNVPPAKWWQAKIEPARLALQWNCVWISMPIWSNDYASDAFYLAFQVLAQCEKRGQHLMIESRQVREIYYPFILEELLQPQGEPATYE